MKLSHNTRVNIGVFVGLVIVALGIGSFYLLFIASVSLCTTWYHWVFAIMIAWLVFRLFVALFFFVTARISGRRDIEFKDLFNAM